MMNENQSVIKMWYMKIILLNLWIFVNVASSLSTMAEGKIYKIFY